MSDQQNPPVRREFIHRAIQLIMLGDVAIGAVLLVLGAFVFEFPAMAIGGAVLALMGLGLALTFRMLARRSGAAGGAGSPPERRRSPHQFRR